MQHFHRRNVGKGTHNIIFLITHRPRTSSHRIYIIPSAPALPNVYRYSNANMASSDQPANDDDTRPSKSTMSGDTDLAQVSQDSQKSSVYSDYLFKSSLPILPKKGQGKAPLQVRGWLQLGAFQHSLWASPLSTTAAFDIFSHVHIHSFPYPYPFPNVIPPHPPTTPWLLSPIFCPSKQSRTSPARPSRRSC